MRQIRVGNMNRFVKVARKHFLEKHFLKIRAVEYLFDALTGEVIEYGDYCHLGTNNDFYALTDDYYPVFEDNKYVGCMWSGSFVTPENFYSI